MDYHELILVPPIESREDLLVQLTFVHALIVASEGLLAAAGLDPMTEGEAGHADWLARDIVELGGTIPLVDHDAASIAGSQYYYIHHVSPLMLLGYRAALELHPLSMESVERLEALYGPLPCLAHHATHDPDHARRIMAQIDAVIAPELRQAIAHNYTLTVRSIASVLTLRQQTLRQPHEAIQ